MTNTQLEILVKALRVNTESNIALIMVNDKNKEHLSKVIDINNSLKSIAKEAQELMWEDVNNK